MNRSGARAPYPRPELPERAANSRRSRRNSRTHDRRAGRSVVEQLRCPPTRSPQRSRQTRACTTSSTRSRYARSVRRSGRRPVVRTGPRSRAPLLLGGGSDRPDRPAGRASALGLSQRRPFAGFPGRHDRGSSVARLWAWSRPVGAVPRVTPMPQTPLVALRARGRRRGCPPARPHPPRYRRHRAACRGAAGSWRIAADGPANDGLPHGR